MDGVKQQLRARQSEALENRHQFEVKKLKREMRSKIDKLNETNEATITQIKKDLTKGVETEKNQLEVQLIGIRKKNNDIIAGEDKRYEQMVEEMKLNHQSKITEMKISQDSEIENRKAEHKDYLENAELKFTSEKAKLEA